MQYLRDLRLTLGSELTDLNLASLLAPNNPALEALDLDLTDEFVSKSINADKGQVLKHTLQDKLPIRLRKITVRGNRVKSLSPTAFKVNLKYISTLCYEIEILYAFL